MPATEHNITIEQGATFELTLLWRGADGLPVDLSGYKARMQARESYSAVTAVLDLDADTLGGIVLGSTAGTIVVTIDAATTEDLTAPWQGVYDLELETPGGVVTRLIKGALNVDPEVTKTIAPS